MNFLVYFLRAFTVSVGITPPAPEKEKKVAVVVFVIFCALIVFMVAFGFAMLHWIAASNQS